MDLRVKRAEILDKLTRMQQSAEKDGGMSSSVSKEFTSMLDQVDSMTKEIRILKNLMISSHHQHFTKMQPKEHCTMLTRCLQGVKGKKLILD